MKESPWPLITTTLTIIMEEENGAALFERRRGCIWSVLNEPAKAAALLKDADLKRRVLLGLFEKLTLGELFQVAAEIEKAERGYTSFNMVESYGRLLKEHFNERPGWTWPDSVPAWLKHFEEHPWPSGAPEPSERQ